MTETNATPDRSQLEQDDRTAEHMPGDTLVHPGLKEQVAQPKSKGKNQQKKKKRKARPKRPLWLRITLRLLGFLLVPFLCAVGLSIGLVAGYVYLGEQPMSEVWEISTWRHIYNLVFQGTS